jgi:hypothetical protein
MRVRVREKGGRSITKESMVEMARMEEVLPPPHFS